MAGRLSLGLYFKWVMLRSISHFSSTVGPHWTCHWSCLARRVRVLLWGRECWVLILQMPGTSWTESLYAHSSLYTWTAGVPALRAMWALSCRVWGVGGAVEGSKVKWGIRSVKSLHTPQPWARRRVSMRLEALPRLEHRTLGFSRTPNTVWSDVLCTVGLYRRTGGPDGSVRRALLYPALPARLGLRLIGLSIRDHTPPSLVRLNIVCPVTSPPPFSSLTVLSKVGILRDSVITFVFL